MAKKIAKKTVLFDLTANDATSVILSSSFNDWKPGELALQSNGEGTWRLSVDLAPGEYEYRFIVDGEWQDDPACPECCPNAFGSQNSVRRV